MNLLPESIHEEIENRQAMFPALADVREIWIVENSILTRERWLRSFVLWAGGELVRSFDFRDGKLFIRSEMEWQYRPSSNSSGFS